MWTFRLLRENLIFVPGLRPWLWQIFSSHAIVKTGSFHLFVSILSFFFFFVSPTEDFFQATLSCLLTAVIQPESSFPETENTGGERTVCELSHAKYNSDKIKLFTNW